MVEGHFPYVLVTIVCVYLKIENLQIQNNNKLTNGEMIDFKIFAIKWIARRTDAFFVAVLLLLQRDSINKIISNGIE